MLLALFPIQQALPARLVGLEGVRTLQVIACMCFGQPLSRQRPALVLICSLHPKYTMSSDIGLCMPSREMATEIHRVSKP